MDPNAIVTTNGPVPPVTFAAPAAQAPPAEPTSGDDEGDGGGDAAAELGDTGIKALRAERTKARAEAKRRAELETELASLLAAAKQTSTDSAVDPKAIAEQAKAEARAELLKDRALDKIEVVAAKTFANPELAVRLLKSDVDSFVANGSVDTDAIKDALADLLDTNPGLAATPEKRFKGSGDGGVRGAQPPDLDTQIAAAAAAGDVRRQLHLQNQKLLPHIQRIVQGTS